jgi:L-lactate utilization protein LutC
MDYNKIPSHEVIEKTVQALKDKGYEIFTVERGAEALVKIKELIPQGASVMNGASVSLEKIGFVDFLKSGQHGWKNLHREVTVETDPAKRLALRRQATLSDYYLGSVHALTETGEFIIASNTGSQLPHIVFNSPSLIFVVGAQKIVPNFDEAMKRLKEYVIPLEEKQMQEKYGVGTFPSKIIIFNRESPSSKRKIRMIIVNEKLGF